MSGFALGQPYGYGQTFQHTVLGAQPGAGAGFTYNVATYDRQRLVAVNFLLTTDANAANRLITIDYSGSGPLARFSDGASVIVTANTTNQQFLGSYRRGVAEWNTNTPVWFPLTGLWLEVGSTVAINIGGVQVGDQLSKIALTFDYTRVQFDGTEPYRDGRAENELAANGATGSTVTFPRG